MYLSYLFLSFFVVMVVLLVVMVLSFSMDSDGSFISSYECGFDPVMESRVNFSFRFFLISILFLIFDVEVSLMLPLPYLSECSSVLVSVGVFLFVLLVGLLYEYYNGVLSWLGNN